MQDRQKTCFVVMGFGEKTDYQSAPPRVLNLNVTYEDIIEPAVTEAGLACVRADQMIHSTVIDKPMYEQLLNADVVVADLSTANSNAIYELGVRHALRPTTTIVMAENNFSFPFDLNHLSILKYEHLGREIGYREVLRVKKVLKEKLNELVSKGEVDSPVYLFLPSLTRAELAATKAMAAMAPAPSSAPTDAQSFADLMSGFRNAQAADDWPVAISFLNRLRSMQSQDAYILQQLALATYKFEQPDKSSALRAAKTILAQLSPETSADPQTTGLWGAVHKRLWDIGADRADLDQALRAYERGFVLGNDYYNGINYAFMLDIRASVSSGEEAVADRVLARRVRTQVLAICDSKMNSPASDREKFEIGASKVEALFGLGRTEEAATLKAAIFTTERAVGGAPAFIEKSLSEQIAKLAQVLARATI